MNSAVSPWHAWLDRAAYGRHVDAVEALGAAPWPRPTARCCAASGSTMPSTACAGLAGAHHPDAGPGAAGRAARADAGGRDAWRFPRGTRLWKEFAYGSRIETRYLELGADGHWRFASYVWAADGRSAQRAPATGRVLAVEDAPFGRYAIPSQDDCLTCHGGARSPVLGVGALQLGPALPQWIERGLIRHAPADWHLQPPAMPGTAAVERAARGYLHANCGHCHHAAGGVPVPLVLALDVAGSPAPVAGAAARGAAPHGHARADCGRCRRWAPVLTDPAKARRLLRAWLDDLREAQRHDHPDSESQAMKTIRTTQTTRPRRALFDAIADHTSIAGRWPSAATLAASSPEPATLAEAAEPAKAPSAAPAAAGRPTVAAGARPLPGVDVGLHGLPHAVEDGRQGPGARPLAPVFGSPRVGCQMPPAPVLQEGPWVMIAERHQHRVGRPLGRELHRQPDARRGDRPGPLDRAADFIRTIRSGRHMGRGREVLPPMPIAGLQQLHRRRSEGHLRLPAHDPADPQPGARSAAAGDADTIGAGGGALNPRPAAPQARPACTGSPPCTKSPAPR
jgi:hypothetical protein